MVLKAEYTKSPSAAILSDVSSCGSLSSSEDGTPRGHSSLSDGELARNLQDSVKHRVLYLSEQRRLEKASREENTVGYLKLVSKADRHHAPHIWQDFEKVNQCASATIAQIERRLCRCHWQLQGLEGGWRPQGLAPKAESSPRHCRRPREKAPSSESPRPGGEDCLSTDLSDIVRHLPLASHFPALWPGKSWGTKRVAQQRNLLLRQMKEDLREVRELHLSLQVSYLSLKESRLMGLQVSLASLQEQKCRQASVEEQVNEHVQGYPDDICHIEQNLARAEEKMAYLSYEGAKEIWHPDSYLPPSWPPAFLRMQTQLPKAMHAPT
ncbi:LOW QUALITY PROTEIN: testis-specific protein TEX28 [Acinonyx jubatus]|uniref:LOW QUALITY PROTEIN: testis-specific protein TEX28 n=1 Tax=Acinonyx jubatus TaxID=32536 RepID=A0ABM3NEK9_ACIJB|nr:LOW QUALITY PROTEIN: testis-specific protein TEX28 [Acinonyx jubatus]